MFTMTLCTGLALHALVYRYMVHPCLILVLCYLLAYTGCMDALLNETEYFGFPCVLSRQSQLLAGFLTRRDILTVLGINVGGSGLKGGKVEEGGGIG